MAKVLISIPDKFLTEIDKTAELEQRTRSELIREALRTYMRRNASFNAAKSAAEAKLL